MAAATIILRGPLIYILMCLYAPCFRPWRIVLLAANGLIRPDLDVVSFLAFQVFYLLRYCLISFDGHGLLILGELFVGRQPDLVSGDVRTI